MDIEQRVSNLEADEARCEEKWESQRATNTVTDRRLNTMSSRLRDLELWRSNLTGKVAVATMVAAFLGSIIAGVVMTAITN